MTALKAIIFYPMLFVRGLFINVSNFIGVILMLFFFVTLIFDVLPWTARLSAFGLAFVLFLLRHFYDVILLKLNPSSNIDLSLYQ